ncbi:protein-disulfide reductase DsbD [Leeia oryzae]|uniref:protein-disulfide reductase DsbD n=1 Tax=Leeia oryzae TaxID=356662 RepID=UPI000376D094|nr:protein-disulfide reductase DsbD [Leeia oryzae]
MRLRFENKLNLLPQELTIMLQRFTHWCWLACLLCLGLLGNPAQAETLIRAREAFIPVARLVAPGSLMVHYEVTPGYYLYKERFQFLLDGKPLASSVSLPQGDLKNDPQFGKVTVYHQSFDFTLPVASPGKPSSLTIQSQGCSEKFRVCFPPEQHIFQIKADGSIINPPPPKASERKGWQSLFSTDDAAGSAAFSTSATHLGLTLLGFFGAGLLMAGTMCMYPLIPIVSALIAGDPKAQQGHRGRSFWLSMSYVQGLALSYTAAGLIAASLGLQLSLWLQNPWVIGGFAVMMLLFAASMFGLFELQLPSTLQTRFTQLANRLPGGHFTSVFVMGMLSALIIGPCATPALAAALLYIAKTGDQLQGGLALYAMALGVGLPLLLIGLAGQHILPKAGAWMTHVRQVFGVVLVLVALWMASPLLLIAVKMGLLGAILVISAIYLSALDALPSRASGWQKLWKGLGVILLVTGAAFLAGAFAGSKDFSRPLAGLSAQADTRPVTAGSTPRFQVIHSPQALDQILASANGKPVLLDFYADWCVSCVEMEKDTFSVPMVQQALSGMILLRADVTANQPGDRALLARFNLFGPPGIILFDGQGRAVGEPIIGFIEAKPFTDRLQQVNRT